MQVKRLIYVKEILNGNVAKTTKKERTFRNIGNAQERKKNIF